MQAVHLTAELPKSVQTKKYIWATDLSIHKYKSCELWMDVFDSLKKQYQSKVIASVIPVKPVSC